MFGTRDGDMIKLYSRISIHKWKLVNVNFLPLSFVVDNGTLIWLWCDALLDCVHADYSFPRFVNKSGERFPAMYGTNSGLSHDSFSN